MAGLRSLQGSVLVQAVRSRVSGPVTAARDKSLGVTKPVTDWVLDRFVVKLMVRTILEMSADDATHMAAGISYYALFSIFPLLLFLVATLGFFMETEEVRLQVLEAFSGYFPGSENIIEQNLNAVIGVSGALGLFGVLGLLWSGSAIFGGVSRSINRAWDVHADRPFFINKPRQLAMAAGVGLLFLLSLSIVAVSRTTDQLVEAEAQKFLPMIGWVAPLGWIAPVVLQISSFMLTTAMFMLMYKYMPNTRTYWQYVWIGAIVAAAFFELAKNVFVIYLSRFANFEDVYGALTPVIVLSLWAYISGLILIFGAELSSEYWRLRQGLERGEIWHPEDAEES